MKIVIVGAGNVATRLGMALLPGNEILQVYSKTPGHASLLARSLNKASQGRQHCRAITDPARMAVEADLYLVAVSDDAIADVAAATAATEGIWAHTSGSVGMEVFSPHKKRYGVFYPLQTLSQGVEMDFSNVPMLIEASDEDVAGKLMSLASTISEKVRRADSATRASLHLAAVFACNFSCLMWLYADRLLRPHGMSLEDMKPLISATLDKAVQVSPEKGMTGPGRRGDLAVIEKQYKALSEIDSGMRSVYAGLSGCILKEYHPELLKEIERYVKDSLRPEENPRDSI